VGSKVLRIQKNRSLHLSNRFLHQPRMVVPQRKLIPGLNALRVQLNGLAICLKSFRDYLALHVDLLPYRGSLNTRVVTCHLTASLRGRSRCFRKKQRSAISRQMLFWMETLDPLFPKGHFSPPSKFARCPHCL